MLATLRSRLPHWRYESSPDGAGKRDVRIDLLRGFCVFVMIVDHVGGETSWLYAFTGGNRFVVSAAEGFLFLSGFSMGMVHHVVIRTKGVRAMVGKVLGRAWLLYTVTVILTIAFAAVSNVLADPFVETLTPARSKTDFFISVVTFHRTYSLTDILVLYTLLMLVAVPAIWLIAHGYTGVVLATSVTTWTVAQLWPDRVPRAWQIIDGGFPFSAWQLMFIIGLVLGFHRNRIAENLKPARLVAFGIACVVALYVVQLIAAGILGRTAADIDLEEILFDKNDARIGRILALFAVASFLYAAVTVWWVPFKRAIGWLLLPMGRRALFAYSVQLFAVAFMASDLMAPVRLDRENAFFQAAAVGIVWLLCIAYPHVEAWWARVVAARRESSKTVAAPAS
jgi:hypothetical protein